MLQDVADKLGIASKPTKELKALETAEQSMIRELVRTRIVKYLK
ncbi:MAG: hypothetical protein ACPL5F_10420 [Moorellaceae bacterium]